MNEIKTEIFNEDLPKDKQIFGLSNYSVTSKYYDDINGLVADKMEDEAGSVANKEFLG